MKTKKKICASLKHKIEENEQKLQMLLIKKNNNLNDKENDDYDNKENKSCMENKIIKISRENSFLTEKNSVNDKSSISISVKNINVKGTNFITSRENKKISSIKHKMKYIKNNYYTDNPLKKLSSKDFLKSKHNVATKKNNSKKKLIINKNHLINKKEPYVIQNYKHHNLLSKEKINNHNTNKINESYIFDSKVTDTLTNTIRNPININQMFKRFEESQHKKNKKLDNLKKQKEEKDRRASTHIPHISKNSKKLSGGLNDDFLTRQKKYNEIKNKKYEELKETILKNEQEKIRRNSFIIPKKHKENLSSNTSFISEVSSGAHSMIEVDNRISKLFEWDNRRKEKIIKLQKEKSKEIKKNKHIPQINKRSKSMVHRGKKENIFIRLAKEDEMVKAKKKIMADLLSPSFKPNINLTFRRFDEDEKNDGKMGKKNSVGGKNHFLRITVNRNDHLRPKDIKKEEILNGGKEIKRIENDEIYDIFRRIIIDNLKRNKSVGGKQIRKYI